jgi:RimJ/RimL family protein N-acetyltransferase
LYPAQWEVTQLFEDGLKVFFRPAKPTDERALKEFFYSLPKNESYFRFLSTMRVFPHYDVRKMVNIDYQSEMSILAIPGDPDAERIVAIGRYTLDEQAGTAEVDFAVHPEYGRKGIASFLVQLLGEMARSKSAKGLTAYVSIGNERVFAVFHRLGYVVESSLRGGVHEIRVHFSQPARACLID